MGIFNKNYVLVSFSGFLVFISFYFLMPIMAMYCVDVFHTSSSTAGVVVASYSMAALFARPFSGYLVDKSRHKKFYMISVAVFASLFLTFLKCDTVLALLITQISLGAVFSMVTTSVYTLIVDTLPLEHRSEGLSYYSAFAVLSMAFGPFLGGFVLDHFSYDGIFIGAFIASIVALSLMFFVKVDQMPNSTKGETLSFNNFISTSAINIAMVIAVVYFLYGVLMAYVALYIKDYNLSLTSGNFFFLLAIGIIVSRLLSGNALRQGKQTIVLQFGLLLTVFALSLFTFLLNDITLAISSLMLGVGIGVTGPAVQTMIINRSASNRIGAANSTYCLSQDLGSGIGMLLGGSIAAMFSYQAIYILGLMLMSVTIVYYNLYVRKKY